MPVKLKPRNRTPYTSAHPRPAPTSHTHTPSLGPCRCRRTLWGVDNGADDLNRSDVGGDVHNDNPGEELNRLDRGGGFYGYPYCWSEFALPAQHARGPTTQWVWPESSDGRNFMTTHSDEWCRNTTHVIPPVMVMQAHTVSLGITFFGTRQAWL